MYLYTKWLRKCEYFPCTLVQSNLISDDGLCSCCREVPYGSVRHRLPEPELPEARVVTRGDKHGNRDYGRNRPPFHGISPHFSVILGSKKCLLGRPAEQLSTVFQTCGISAFCRYTQRTASAVRTRPAAPSSKVS